MRLVHLLWSGVLSSLPLLAQNIDVLGGTSTPETLTAVGKGNVVRVDSSVLLTQFEMHLNIPGSDTLTFFLHEHNSRNGSATQIWSTSIAVNGAGLGPTFWSSGPVNVPLLCGHHYALGVSWANSLTDYYDIGPVAGTPISFGAWVTSVTTANPPPASIPITILDRAQFYERITTIPIAVMNCRGPGCSITRVLPRLVASNLPQLGATTILELLDVTPGLVAIFVLSEGPALPAPLPMLGCGVWLNLAGGTVSVATTTSPPGTASLAVAVPQNQTLRGAVFTAQSGVLRTGSVDVSNAVEFTIN